MTMISIAMATYNGASYLGVQLASLGRQSRLPDELVVTDDGSTDDTLAILEGFAREAPFPVQLHRNPSNLGYALNFEKAAKLCRGDIIFFCDQDDRWDSSKIETMTKYFAERPDLMVLLCDARLCDGQLRDSGRTQYDNVREVGLADFNYVMGCASASRREWIDILVPLPPGRTHDFWFNQTAHLAGLAAILDRPLQDYRRHGANESQTPLSNPDGVRAIDLLSGHGLSDVRRQWTSMIETLEIMVERLSDGAALTGLPQEPRNIAIGRLTNRILAFQRRIALCSMPRLMRFGRARQMWRLGDYQQFMGIKSMLKDLIRP